MVYTSYDFEDLFKGIKDLIESQENTFSRLIFDFVEDNDVALEDIWTIEKLSEKLKDEYDIMELYSFEDIKDAILDSDCPPENIFDDEELEKWALDNGFVKAESEG